MPCATRASCTSYQHWLRHDPPSFVTPRTVKSAALALKQRNSCRLRVGGSLWQQLDVLRQAQLLPPTVVWCECRALSLPHVIGWLCVYMCVCVSVCVYHMHEWGPSR
jgi:hypothetical protein